MRHRPLAIAVSVPLLFACIILPGGGGGGGRDTFAGALDTSIEACVPSEAPTLMLGMGRDSFEPIPASVEAESGSQGGQHVWLAFRSTGLDVSDTSVVWITAKSEGVAHVDQTARLAWSCDDSGLAEVVGLQVPVPIDALGQWLLFEVTVTDAAGGSVESSAVVLVN